jgi:hypothetical protein
MSRIVAAWFREDAKDQASWYPQVGADSSLPEFQKVYWRCVPTFYASCRRFNPDVHLRFYTNASLPIVDGVDIGELLAGLEVEIVDIPYEHLPPVGYFGQWRNQFFVLDILQNLSDESFESCIVLDTDCVFTGSLRPLFDVLESDGAATYVIAPVALDPSFSNNGLTAAEMDALAAEVVGRNVHVAYCGGEIVALRADVLATVAKRADEVWRDSIARHERGERKFNEEAQLLSCIYAELDLPVGLAEPYIRRIWTQRARSVQADDLLRPIWHLPGEKHYGFRQVVPQLRNRGSWFWAADDATFRAQLGQAMGLPRRRPSKWVRDHADFVRRSAKRRLDDHKR